MNKSKKVVIITSIIVIFISILYILFYLLLSYSLRINGSDKIYLGYSEKYTDKGATLNILGINLNNRLKITNSVKAGKLGSYQVIYKARIPFFNVKKVRTVNVIDNISPKITLVGSNRSNACPHQKYKEEGYKAVDELDGDITNKVVVTLGENIITYEVSDTYGNKQKVTRQIASIDEIPPSITLKGNKTTYIRNGGSYFEYGYNTTDNCDNNVKVEVTGSVDTSKDGTYKLTYMAIDSSGNKSYTTRDVIVYTDNRVGVVYLTFDDGPSSTGSTEKILNILKKEGVRATFFVTGSGPDSLIKREYNEGHTVALHTNTHNYSVVYSSIDNYYKDLNAVRNRVYNITGHYTNIIRFPGGSNNTVSNRYYNGIMDILTKDVMNSGYIYYDWNVTSGDAGECTTPDCVYNRVTNGLSKDRINIVLMHDIKMFTANALKDIITYCKNNGYVFEVITEKTPQVRFK